MPVPHKPTGYQAVIPYLIAEDVGAIMDFLKAAVGAEEIERIPGPGGRVMHGEVRVDDCIIMMGSAREQNPATESMIYIYLPDVDDAYARALEAGAESISEPADQFYGDRVAGVRDQAGNQWFFSTHIEDVSEEEINRRLQAMQGEGGGQ